MFKITIKGPEAGKIQRLADIMHGQLVQAVGKVVKDAEGISKRNFLSGPNYRGKKNPTPGPVGVLGWKTGHLKGSVRSDVSDEGKIIRGTLQAGPLPYARIHEYGGMAGRGHHARIPKRAYLMPALQAVQDRLKAAIDEIFMRFGK